MSTFIDKADYAPFIQNGILDAITESDDPKLDIVEGQAIEEMKSALSSRYDVVNIFNKTAANRNPVILMYAIDITLYHLHSRINPRKIPELRKERYQSAKEWLDLVQKGERNPVDLPVLPDGEKDYVLYGSNQKRTNHI